MIALPHYYGTGHISSNPCTITYICNDPDPIEPAYIYDNKRKRVLDQMRKGWTKQQKHLHTMHRINHIDIRTRNRLKCTRKLKQSIRGRLNELK